MKLPTWFAKGGLKQNTRMMKNQHLCTPLTLWHCITTGLVPRTRELKRGRSPAVLSEIACLATTTARHRIPTQASGKGSTSVNVKRVAIAIIIAVFLQLGLGHG